MRVASEMTPIGTRSTVISLRPCKSLTAALTEDATAVLVAVRLGNIYAKMARSDCGRAELTAAAARVPESTEIQGALKALR